MDAHIKRLQDTIYPRIDAFVRDTKAVISAELNADITNYSLEQVKDLAGTLKDEMGVQVWFPQPGTRKPFADRAAL